MLTNVKQKIKIRQFLNPKSFYINVRLDLKVILEIGKIFWRLVMNGITGYAGYPNQFQVYANPTGAGLANLNAEYARDFGLGMPQVYNLPLNVNMGFGPGALDPVCMAVCTVCTEWVWACMVFMVRLNSILNI